ncbi:MAG: ribosome-associated translation inhibitor RaiA [Nitrospinota bacterium]
MLVNIQGRNMKVTPALKSYALEKVSVLNKYLDFNLRIHVTLSTNKFRQRAEIAVNGKGAHLHGMEEGEDMYASIDKLMDKIARQARKVKEKRKDHHAPSLGEIPLAEIEPENSKPKIVRKKFDLEKPISTDEAMDKMNDENKLFLIYKNESDERLNVLYLMSDGTLGLIEV